MKNSAQYNIHPELKVMVEYFSGLVNLNSMIDHRKALIKENLYDPGFNSITDFRDANFEAKREDVINYAKFTKSTPSMLGKRKAAILANTPQQNVITRLYTLNTQDLPFIIEIFYTLDAALNWINLTTDDMGIIENTLHEMRNRAII